MAAPTRDHSRGVLQLAAPLVFSFWFRSAFQWVDTLYAAQLEGVGDESIAAIGLTVPFEFMMIACWAGASNGLTSRLSAAMGARQGARIEQLLKATVRIVLALWLVFLLIAAGIWIGAPRVGLEPVLARQFQVYGAVLMAGSGFTAFWSVLPDSIVRAHHDTRSTMWAGVVSTLVNVALNTLFVFAFHWGIFGIAFATGLGRLGGLAYATTVARRHEHARKAEGLDGAPELYARPVRAILSLSVSAGLSYFLMAVESLAVNAMLAATSDPTSTLAAWSIFDRTARFLAMPTLASSMAMLPVAARLHGAGNLASIRRELRTILVASAGYALLFVAPLVFLAGPWLAHALIHDDATADRAARALRFVPLVLLLMSPMFQIRSTFEGLQRARPGLVVSFLRTAAFVVPLVWLGLRVAPSFGWDPLTGACLGLSLGAALASAVIGTWFRAELAPRVAA
jgi:Na+-driven multidrug efflux pump